MKGKTKRKRNPVPLRAISGETGISLKHVWRIVNRREQYSKASEQKVKDAITKLKLKKAV